jgi:hypothetical protein
MSSRLLTPDVSVLGIYLGMLCGAEPDGAYVELRWRLRAGRGMGREFVAVRDPRLADLIQARGRETDIYAAVAPRSRLEGTRAAVERCHVLFVDCDTPESIAALDAFQPSPSMIVNSGHGKHGYWSLWPPVGPDELERANRRLAHALAADMRATDAARILRPPGTFNHKSGEPVPVTLERLEVEVYTAEQVTGGLPDPPDSRAREDRASGAVRPLSAVPDRLADIAPPVYFEALTGLVPDRDGKVCCPLPGHDDSTPSCHVYDDAEDGWHCFGCGRGGTVYTLAALLADYSLPLRGADFIAVRGVLLDHLAAEAA